MQRMFQRNGAPRGYGQQRGHSIYLDQPGVNTSGDMRRREPTLPDVMPDPQVQAQQSLAQVQSRPRGQSFMQNLGAFAAGMRDQDLKGRGKVRNGQGYDSALNDPYAPPAQPKAFLEALDGQAQRQAPSVSGMAPPAAAPWQRGQIVGAARQGADFSRLGGGFGDANTDSMKHTFGRIAQNFDVSDAGLQALVADEEFRRLFPNATLENDWIDFGGQLDPHTGTNIGKIDVQQAWRRGGSGNAWQWLPEDVALAAAQGPQLPLPSANETSPSFLQALEGLVPQNADIGTLLQMLLEQEQMTY